MLTTHQQSQDCCHSSTFRFFLICFCCSVWRFILALNFVPHSSVLFCSVRWSPCTLCCCNCLLSFSPYRITDRFNYWIWDELLHHVLASAFKIAVVKLVNGFDVRHISRQTNYENMFNVHRFNMNHRIRNWHHGISEFFVSRSFSMGVCTFSFGSIEPFCCVICNKFTY